MINRYRISILVLCLVTNSLYAQSPSSTTTGRHVRNRSLQISERFAVTPAHRRQRLQASANANRDADQQRLPQHMAGPLFGILNAFSGVTPFHGRQPVADSDSPKPAERPEVVVEVADEPGEWRHNPEIEIAESDERVPRRLARAAEVPDFAVRSLASRVNKRATDAPSGYMYADSTGALLVRDGKSGWIRVDVADTDQAHEPKIADSPEVEEFVMPNVPANALRHGTADEPRQEVVHVQEPEATVELAPSPVEVELEPEIVVADRQDFRPRVISPSFADDSHQNALRSPGSHRLDNGLRQIPLRDHFARTEREEQDRFRYDTSNQDTQTQAAEPVVVQSDDSPLRSVLRTARQTLRRENDESPNSLRWSDRGPGTELR